MAEQRAADSPYPFVKGHGTENDFVLLPDHDGAIHGDLSIDRVRALCDRRAGIGADGVLRVIRARALGGVDGAATDDIEWFMDYRNSDGSVSEMCGNGVRVLALHLVQEGLADPSGPIRIGTRDGVKTLSFTGGDAAGLITADMGRALVLGETSVEVAGRRWPAQHVDMGNPHAVAFVDDLEDAGPLLRPPGYDEGVYPQGVNVEFVVRRAARQLDVRVHERGSGETRSCGTGACAVMVAAAHDDAASRNTSYEVRLPGGTLEITWTSDDRILMTGPAVIVAQGTSTL